MFVHLSNAALLGSKFSLLLTAGVLLHGEHVSMLLHHPHDT
jgi:hypothetical protein